MANSTISVPVSEDDSDSRAGTALDFHGPVELLYQRPYKGEPEGPCLIHVQFLG